MEERIPPSILSIGRELPKRGTSGGQESSILRFLNCASFSVGDHPYGRSALRRSSMGHGRQRDRGWGWALVVEREPGDRGKIPGARKTTRASPGLVTDRIINIGEVLLELNADN